MTASATIDIPTTTLDIMSDALAADPFPALATLRALGPVVWHESYKRWLITTDREVRKLVVDFRRFTVEGTTVEALFGAEAFISMDDRRKHDDLRGVWTNAFRKQSLDTLRSTVERIVSALVGSVAERLRAGEEVDLSEALCRPLPTMVIALMMGVPDDMLADVVRWSDAMAGGGPAYLLSNEAAKAAIQRREDAKAALADYLTAQIVARRHQPGDDLVSILVHADAAIELSDSQLVQNVRQLLFAGNETTAKWLAQLCLTYGEDADVRRKLVADRALILAANDEVMRWQGPIGTLVRRVRGGPIEIAGIELADGDEVTCVLASANRDPARFADPDRLDIHRAIQPNLGFGIGFHNCLGSTLAKMEAEIAINHLLDVAPDYRIAAPYRYTTLPLRGPLPVTIAYDKN